MRLFDRPIEPCRCREGDGGRHRLLCGSDVMKAMTRNAEQREAVSVFGLAGCRDDIVRSQLHQGIWPDLRRRNPAEFRSAIQRLCSAEISALPLLSSFSLRQANALDAIAVAIASQACETTTRLRSSLHNALGRYLFDGLAHPKPALRYAYASSCIWSRPIVAITSGRRSRARRKGGDSSISASTSAPSVSTVHRVEVTYSLSAIALQLEFAKTYIYSAAPSILAERRAGADQVAVAGDIVDARYRRPVFCRVSASPAG